MKATIKKAGILGTLSAVTLGIMSASAMGGMNMMHNNLTPDEVATRQTSMFTEQASLIGATVDEVKNAWAEGKNLKDLAKEKGITQEQLQAKMKANRDAHMKEQLATLVSKGVITQAQADKRIAFMNSLSSQKGKGYSGHGMHKGMEGMIRGGF